jgi:hypothetical protein
MAQKKPVSLYRLLGSLFFNPDWETVLRQVSKHQMVKGAKADAIVTFLTRIHPRGLLDRRLILYAQRHVVLALIELVLELTGDLPRVTRLLLQPYPEGLRDLLAGYLLDSGEPPEFYLRAYRELPLEEQFKLIRLVIDLAKETQNDQLIEKLFVELFIHPLMNNLRIGSQGGAYALTGLTIVAMSYYSTPGNRWSFPEAFDDLLCSINFIEGFALREASSSPH